MWAVRAILKKNLHKNVFISNKSLKNKKNVFIHGGQKLWLHSLGSTRQYRCDDHIPKEEPPKAEDAKVEKVVDSVEAGESPHWDVESQSLYFVDIFGKAIHKYVPATKKHTRACIRVNFVSLIVPVEGEKNKFLVSIGRDLALVTWDGEQQYVQEIETIYEIDPEKICNRFSEGKCDACGRFWGGSMGPLGENGHAEPNQGTFISFGPSKTEKIHMTEVGISNGLAWSLDDKNFYHIDGHKGTVDQYDFDTEKGAISNRKVVFTLNKTDIVGKLFGMTIDICGNLWIAIFGGDAVIKIDPRKPETLLDCIKLPAHQVTSVAFGGPELDQLYVTSARVTIDGKEYKPPDHGATYVITGTGAKGLGGARFKL